MPPFFDGRVSSMLCCSYVSMFLPPMSASLSMKGSKQRGSRRFFGVSLLHCCGVWFRIVVRSLPQLFAYQTIPVLFWRKPFHTQLSSAIRFSWLTREVESTVEWKIDGNRSIEPRRQVWVFCVCMCFKMIKKRSRVLMQLSCLNDRFEQVCFVA